ncbi:MULTISPECIES: WGR domain-containing protein [Rhodoplanes]|nr:MULTISPECIES: WGR domain-containing protein [Rhodoplanes]
MARFYRLDVQPDLFGGCSLICEWGRIGQPGTVRTTSYGTVAEAEVARARQSRLKARRGYSRPWIEPGQPSLDNADREP